LNAVYIPHHDIIIFTEDGVEVGTGEVKSGNTSLLLID
jgi:hypothetical protein